MQFVEKIRDNKGNITDLQPVSVGEVKPTGDDEYPYVQVVHGRPVAAFRNADILVLV